MVPEIMMVLNLFHCNTMAMINVIVNFYCIYNIINVTIIQYGSNCILGMMEILGQFSNISPKKQPHISFSTI